MRVYAHRDRRKLHSCHSVCDTTRLVSCQHSVRRVATRWAVGSLILCLAFGHNNNDNIEKPLKLNDRHDFGMRWNLE